jgi:hypothetical protein
MRLFNQVGNFANQANTMAHSVANSAKNATIKPAVTQWWVLWLTHENACLNPRPTVEPFNFSHLMPIDKLGKQQFCAQERL